MKFLFYLYFITLIPLTNLFAEEQTNVQVKLLPFEFKPTAISSTGIIAGTYTPSNTNFLYPATSSLGNTPIKVSNNEFIPTSINNRGDIVGIKTTTQVIVTPDSTYTHYVYVNFVADLNSGLLTTITTKEPNTVKVFLDDLQKIVILTPKIVYFYQKNLLIRTVTLNAQQQLRFDKPALLLSNGNIVAPLIESGASKYIIVGQNQIPRVIENEIIPTKAFLLRQESNNSLSYSVQGDGIYKVNFETLSLSTRALSTVRRSNELIYAKTESNIEIYSDSAFEGIQNLQFTPIAKPFIRGIQGRAYPARTALECILPGTKNLNIQSLNAATDTGFLVANFKNANAESLGYGLITIFDQTNVKNYCSNVSVSISKYCKDNSKRLLTGNVCPLTIKLKNALGSLLKRKQVAIKVNNESRYRVKGRTDNAGTFKLSYPIKTGVNTLEILAPYKDRELRGASTVIKFTGK